MSTKDNTKKRGYHRSKIKGDKSKEYKSESFVLLSEFRFNNVRQHPAYVFGRQGKYFLCIGITHAPKTQNVRNIDMLINPDPEDKRKSYFRPKVLKDRISKFGKIRTNWKLSKDDDDKMKAYREPPATK